MAARLLLPGYGGRYTTETFDSNSAVGADTLDCSHLDSLGIQVDSSGIAGTVDIEQTFNGTDWAVLVDNMVCADGTATRLDTTDGPFGLLRVNATDITSGTASLAFVGFSKRPM